MSISNRKADHIQLCIDGDVGFHQKSTLFEDIDVIHNALPELSLDEIDLSSDFAGKKLRYPLIIAAMTGGVEKATKINRDLAEVAEKLGIGFAFGSQRPLLTHGIADGYTVRDVAPNCLLLGNLGVVQAKEAKVDEIEKMIQISAVDALCIHLNPAMEVVQPEGDRDFSGGLQCIEHLHKNLSIPIVVKETGCGISKSVAERLKNIGIQWIDVSGAGGTSWVAVEAHRAQDSQKSLGQRFWDWGIPTAASVGQLQGLDLGICATGGIQNGLMIGKALAMGAKCGGIARNVLQVYDASGKDGVEQYLNQVIDEIRVFALLCGARNIADLQKIPLILGEKIQKWLPHNSPLFHRRW